jgi:hypothetical protein
LKEVINIKQSNYFIRLYKGDISLGVTFWGWFILANLIIFEPMELLFNNINVVKLNISVFLMLGLTIFSFFYMAFILTAIWKSSTKHKGTSFWAKIAKLIVIGNIFYFIFLFYKEGNIYFNEEKRLEKEIQDLNAKTPYKIQEQITITEALIENKKIYYTYKLNYFKNTKLHGINRQLFKDDVVKQMCEDKESKNLIYKDYSFILNYQNRNDVIFTTVNIRKEICENLNINEKILKKVLSSNNQKFNF